MTRFVVGLVLLTWFAAAAAAQTVTAKATWTMAEAPALAQGFTYTLKLGTTTVPMGVVTCTAVAGVTQCQAPLTPPVAPGSYTLTVFSGIGTPATSDPFAGNAAGKPLQFTFSITFTVP